MRVEASILHKNCTNERPESCLCRWCSLSREITEVKAGGNPALMRAMIDRLFGELGETAEDLSYNRAILDGSWPSAVELLEAALAKAKEKRAGK